MADGPVESRGTRAGPARVAASEPADDAVPFPRLGDEVPRVVVKADLLPAISVLSLVSLLGLPLGWLWSELAPPTHNVVTRSGGLVPPMIVESYRDFDSLGMFILLSGAFGVLTGAVLWLLRRRRGPVVLIGAILGSLIGSWLGVQVGVSNAMQHYPMPPNPQIGDLITLAPQISTMWVVLAQPFMLAIVYGLSVSWNGLDDLGRRLG